MNSLGHQIIWDKSLELGVEQVDSEHRQLVSLVNELIHSCIEGTEKEHLDGTLNFLLDYTFRHFSNEEDLQVRCDYPDRANHKQLHEAFVVEVDELVGQFDESGSSTELVDNVKSVVVNWLIKHIQDEDLKIGEHIRQTGFI